MTTMLDLQFLAQMVASIKRLFDILYCISGDILSIYKRSGCLHLPFVRRIPSRAVQGPL